MLLKPRLDDHGPCVFYHLSFLVLLFVVLGIKLRTDIGPTRQPPPITYLHFNFKYLKPQVKVDFNLWSVYSVTYASAWETKSSGISRALLSDQMLSIKSKSKKAKNKTNTFSPLQKKKTHRNKTRKHFVTFLSKVYMLSFFFSFKFQRECSRTERSSNTRKIPLRFC